MHNITKKLSMVNFRRDITMFKVALKVGYIRVPLFFTFLYRLFSDNAVLAVDLCLQNSTKPFSSLSFPVMHFQRPHDEDNAVQH